MCFFHQFIGFSYIYKSSGYDIRAADKLIRCSIQGKDYDHDTILCQMLSVTENDISNIPDTKTVHQNVTYRYLAGYFCRLL